MDQHQRAELETELKQRFEAGDLPGAVTRAIEGYGREIFGLLVAVTRQEDHAEEVFAEVCAALWKELAGFRWECSFRTWAYAIARYQLIAFRNDPSRRLARNLPLSRTPELDGMAAQVRTITQTFRRTDVKEGVARLRERLDPDDQTLLILRVDRDLSWREVSRVMDGANEAALRKRYERIKDRLREMAREEGLR